MATKCANPSCSACYHRDEGKLFRLDFEIASTAGATQHKTAFVWLCSRCAQQMNPRVEVTKDTVRVLLAAVQSTMPKRPTGSALVN
jgi:hypothetical protein